MSEIDPEYIQDRIAELTEDQVGINLQIANVRGKMMVEEDPEELEFLRRDLNDLEEIFHELDFELGTLYAQCDWSES